MIRDTFTIPNITSPYDTYPQVNIIAEIEGYEKNAGVVILGGHYDASGSREGSSIWYSNWNTMHAQGADDNASGISALMEIARVFSDQSSELTNRRTIRFIAFAAEEYHPLHPNYHHVGSLYDAYNLSILGDPVEAVIILDMIAYNPIDDYIEIISDTQSLWVADSVEVFADRYVPDLLTNHRPFPDVPYSDHDSYQQYGYPAILLMENDSPWNDDPPWYLSNPHYHTTSDTIGTLRMTQLVKVCQLALASVMNFADYGGMTAISDESQPENNDLKVTVSPNPFNSVLRASVTGAYEGRIQAHIYDVRGARIKTISIPSKITGQLNLQWDGTDESGVYVGSGTYFLMVSDGHARQVQKIVYLK